MFQEVKPLASSYIFFRADQYGVGLIVHGKLHWDRLEHLTVMSFEGDLLDSDAPRPLATRGSKKPKTKERSTMKHFDIKRNISPAIEAGREVWHPWKACITSILEALSECQNIRTIRFQGVRPHLWTEYFWHFLKDHSWTYPEPFSRHPRWLEPPCCPEHREPDTVEASKLSAQELRAEKAN